MMEALRRLWRRRESDYYEIPSHSSGWEGSPHEYLDNLGGPILSPVMVRHSCCLTV